MKEIQLSKQGKHKGKYVTLVDDEDFMWLNQFNWNVSLHKNSDLKYCVRNGGKGVAILMHRYIMGVTDREIKVSHVDGNRLNNCRSNLRVATQTEVQRDRRKIKIQKHRKVSIYKGVSWVTNKKKWKAGARLDRDRIHIGYFTTEKEAALAYNEFAKKNFSEFARLNTVQGEEK